MLSKLSGWSHIAALIAVVASFLSRIDVATKAAHERLHRAAEAHGLGLSWRDAYEFSGMAMPAISGGAGSDPSGRGAHHDAPLANLAVQAFQTAQGFIGPRLFPIVPVGKQSDRYYIVDPDSWLRIPDTARAPKTRPNRVNFKVSSDAYFAKNYALAGDNAKEDLANADLAVGLRENTTRIVVYQLLADLEVRIASKVLSISNVGSGVALTGVNKWSDYVNSDPIADVTTAHAFIRSKTGLVPNTLAMDEDTYQIVRRHPVIIDLYKAAGGFAGGLLSDEQLKAAFSVQELIRSSAIKNNALENATASMTNIWGNAVVLAHVQPGVSLQLATFGVCMQWTPEGFPAPMQVSRYDDPDPGVKAEVIEAGYFQDEKIVAKDLCYVIKDTL